MYVYTCDDKFESMMTCIYDAWSSRKGHSNILLELEPVAQAELFCEYIHVDADQEKAAKVIRSVQNKISHEAYWQIFRAAMSFEPDRLDAIYRFMILGFAYGRQVTSMLTEMPVIRILELERKVANETHYFREFTRFTSVDRRVYVSHIEPKCNVLSMVAEHFADRMPSEYWIMIDDNRKLAAVHAKDEAFYITVLSADEFSRFKELEKERDEYTELWLEFFRTIGIEARKNPRCQRNMLPLWYRKHMTEFMEN